MTKQRSLTRIERNLKRVYRRDLGLAESAPDVRNFFFYAIRELFTQIFADRINVGFTDVRLDANSARGFVCSARLRAEPEFKTWWQGSELPDVMSRLAESANHQLMHLAEHNPLKTEVKMYPTPGHTGRFFGVHSRGR